MRKWIIIFVVVAAVVAGGAYWFFGRDGATASASPTPANAEKMAPVVASNDVVADAVVVPLQSARLSMPAGGIAAEVLVDEGDEVEAGQPLLRLGAARQAAAVAQAEAQVRQYCTRR